MSPRGGIKGPRYRPGIGQEPTRRQCPKCHSQPTLGPRVVRDDEEWCNCYSCGHAWAVNKKRVRKGDEPKPSWNPKMRATT